MPELPLYSQEGYFAAQHRSRFSLPVLAGVLGVHALLVAWMLVAHAPASPDITPPMMGILLSDASSAGEQPAPGMAKSQPKAQASAEKKEKRPDLPTTAKPSAQSPTAEAAKITDANDTATPPGSTAAAHGLGYVTPKAGNTGPAGGTGGNHASGATGTFFSPRVDAPGAYNPKPRYPATSRRMGEEGTVTLSVHVLATGQVADVRLKKTSGYARLDHAAMDAVKTWRYLPARQGDTPVNYWYTQAVKFSLTD